MKIIVILIFFISNVFLVSCGNDFNPEPVDSKQVEVDGSTNDRYLFKREIEKEKWRENRYKKNEF